MRATQHPSNNRVLGAPAGWNQQELPVGAIAITDIEERGMPAVLSYWRPSAEELVALNAGALVTLCILGSTMPPVSLNVDA